MFGWLHRLLFGKNGGKPKTKPSNLRRVSQKAPRRVPGQSTRTGSPGRSETARRSYIQRSSGQKRGNYGGSNYIPQEKKVQVKKPKKEAISKFDAYKKRLQESTSADKIAEDIKKLHERQNAANAEKAKKASSDAELKEISDAKARNLRELEGIKKKGGILDPRYVEDINKQIKHVKSKDFDKAYKKEKKKAVAKAAKEDLNRRLTMIGAKGLPAQHEEHKKVTKKIKKEAAAYEKKNQRKVLTTDQAMKAMAMARNSANNTKANGKNYDKKYFSDELREQIRANIQSDYDKGSVGTGFMSGSMPVGDLKKAAERTYGIKLDDTRARQKLGFNVAEMAGYLTKSYAFGGATEETIAKALTKVITKKTGKQAVGKAGKFAVNRAAEAIAATPVNLEDAARNSKDAKDFAKNVAINAGLDAGLGSVIDGGKFVAKAASDKATRKLLVKIDSGAELSDIERKSLQKKVTKVAGKKIAGGDLTEVEKKLYTKMHDGKIKKTLETKTTTGQSKMASSAIGGDTSHSLEPKKGSGTPSAEVPSEAPYTVDAKSPTTTSETDYTDASKNKEALRTTNIPPKASTPVSTSDNAFANASINNIPENSQNINIEAEKLNMDVRAQAKSKIQSSIKEDKPSIKQMTKDAVDWFNRKFVDSMDSVNKIAKETGNEQLVATANMARGASKIAENHIGIKQTDFFGKEVGKSLKSIFNPIKKKGTGYFNDFQEYMFHLHNVDRMKQNKPVFGEEVTADESKSIATGLLKQHPEFANLGEDVRKYLSNLQQYRIDSGMLSKESADLMDEMYKNYVPTYRKVNSTSGIKVKDGQITINGIKKATGSDKSLLPLDVQIARMTMDTVKSANTNKLINALVEATGVDIKKAGKITADDLEELMDASSSKSNGKFTMIGYKDGHKFEVEIDHGLFEGLDSLKGKPISNSEAMNKLYNGLKGANNAFKALITSWNPLFIVRNVERDIQDTTIYSKSLSKFTKQSPRAVAEMAGNGKWWQLYKSMGGVNSSFFDHVKGIQKDSNWLKKNTLDRIDDINMYTEQFPRFTEFMASIENSGIDDINKLYTKEGRDVLEKAILTSADVTVNFGRSGTIGKILNQSLVPFFNPAMQGFDKFVRTVKDTKGVKDWGKLIFKVSMFGMAPSAINELLLGDDEQYQSINDREKDTNYIFKLGDNQFLKIPKGRVLSMFGGTAQRIIRDTKGYAESDWGDFINTAIDQVAPVNPLESNFFSPLYFAATNKTWYGGEIENSYMKELPKSERYDAQTSKIAKLVGEKFGWSPKKIDYVLDAYTGVIGDFALPALSEAASRNPAQKAFMIDTVLQNSYATKFYDKMDANNMAVNSKNVTDADRAQNEYLKENSYRVSNISAAIRSVQENKKLSKDEKMKMVRELTNTRNKLYKYALNDENVFNDYVKINKDKFSDKENLYKAAYRYVERKNGSAITDLESIKKTMGAEAALKSVSYEYNDVYSVAKQYVKDGGSYEKFYDSYKTVRKMQRETGSNYETVTAVALVGAKADKKVYKAYGISEKDKTTAQQYYKDGGSEKEFSRCYESMNNACQAGKKDKYWAPYKALGLADVKAIDRVYAAVDSASTKTKTIYKMNTGRGLVRHGVTAKTLSALDDRCGKNDEGYNTSSGVQKILDKTNYNREEKALLWDALYGLSYKETNPYGLIGNYGLKTDVGIDTGGGYKRYGSRGYRQYGGRYGRGYRRNGGRGSSGSSEEERSEFEKYIESLMNGQQSGSGIEEARMNYGSRKLNTKQYTSDQYRKAVARVLAKKLKA